MSWTKFRVVGLVATGALLAGCAEDTVGSDVIRTGGIWAEYTVTATRANEANAKAALRVGGPDSDTLAVLVAPDTLLVSAIGEEKTMTPSGCESNRYCARFNANLGGEEVAFNFDRGEDNENAPDSRVEMPEPFTLSIDDDSFERGQPVSFSWDGSGGALEWEIKGNCIWTEDGIADDDGSYAIRPEVIRERSGREEDECEVTVTVKRTSIGSIDSRFAGGTIRAIQERKVTFISYPEGGDVPDPTTTDETSTNSTSEPDMTSSGGDDGGTPEAGSPEAGSPEAGSPEAGSPEAGSPEAGDTTGTEATDTEATTETTDTEMTETTDTATDAGADDAGSDDGGSDDAGSDDAGSDDAGDAGDAG